MTALPELLAELIRYDTRNPGGNEAELANHLMARLQQLGADQLRSERVGEHAYLLAVFGRPRVLVNAHLDTVPPAAGWSRPPHDPWLDGGRLYGLGAADTKGAIAALLGALERA